MARKLQHIDDELRSCMQELQMLQSRVTPNQEPPSFKIVLTRIKNAAVDVANGKDTHGAIALFNTAIRKEAERMENKLNALNIENADDWKKMREEIKRIHHTLSIISPWAEYIGQTLGNTRLKETCENVMLAIYIDEKKFKTIQLDKRNEFLIKILSDVGKSLYQENTSYYDFQGEDGARRMNAIIMYLKNLKP